MNLKSAFQGIRLASRATRHFSWPVALRLVLTGRSIGVVWREGHVCLEIPTIVE
jgi:hypothetical protein